MAPDARIVSIKVGDADGGTDVSQVIAAIDWIVQHAHDPGLNIRVLNLSYGTNSTQAYTRRPARLRGRAGVEARASSSWPPPATPATSAAAARPGSPTRPTTRT